VIPDATALAPRLIPLENEGPAAGVDLRRLTTALAHGDDQAWLEFHRLYGPALLRQLLALTRGDHDVAKEALQRTYLRVAKHVRACESEAMFRSWLRTVARSALQDCWRHQRSFTDLLFRKYQEPPELADPASDDLLVTELDAALGRLDAADRALLEEKYFNGCEVRTIAEKLTLSPKAVESRLPRARDARRRQLLPALRRHE